jgi:hypothetical protein
MGQALCCMLQLGMIAEVKAGGETMSYLVACYWPAKDRLQTAIAEVVETVVICERLARLGRRLEQVPPWLLLQ